jgi:hypothetical protein
MVSRASHYAAKKQHAQRELTYVKPAPLDNDSWIQEGMAVSRLLAAETSNSWGVLEYSEARGLTPKEADRQLRHMSKMEFLTMSVQRADGAFVRYVWRLTDPDLPVR